LGIIALAGSGLKMLYIRTDANKKIAAGHVMRCLAIAAELRKRGEETTFLITEKEAGEIISRFHFPFIILPGAWNDLEVGMDELINLIILKKMRKLLVDSYFATLRYFEVLSKYVKLIYLGSIEQPYPGLSLLINYSNSYDADFYVKAYDPSITKLLLGVKYTPLREEFQGFKTWIRKDVKNILITTGSSDENKITESLTADLLACSSFNELNYHLVVGCLNPNKHSLEMLKKKHHKITLHSNAAGMAALMRSCDLAVSASGTTIYELCACGIPTVCFSIANEQDKNGIKFHDDKVMLYAGSIVETHDECIKKIKNYLKCLITDFELRKNFAFKMNDYIDGNGCQRIAEEIINL